MAENTPISFDRRLMLDALRSADRPFDVLIIGGGATGLATAVDSASRGYRTALVERGDFASGTSSHSTKLVHGGVRYLQQGRVGLVRESLRERRTLMRNAPHLVSALPTVIPAYSLWERMKYASGLMLYDLLAAGSGIGRTRLLGMDETASALPGVERDRLRGGVLYYDGQTDDARLAVTLAQTAADHGAVVANYVKAVDLVKERGRTRGIDAEDVLSGDGVRIRAKVVINATGVYTDDMRSLDASDAPRVMRWSRGTHIVLSGSLLPGGHGLLVPETADGRVIFALPWLGSTLVGTTDVPVKSPDADPEPPQEDVEFLLDELARYLPAARDVEVKSAFTGIRPLVAGGSSRRTSGIARSHRVMVSESGMVTITGGKWTTARLMAEHAVNRALRVAGLEPRASRTSRLPLHGSVGGEVYREAISEPGYLYGTEIETIAEAEKASPELSSLLDDALPYRMSQAIHAVRYEMAQTVEDVLARRTRSLLLDVEAAVAAAPEVTHMMAKELGRDMTWEAAQVEAVRRAARSYRVME